jgi:SNF family Na+-dependent transporter
MAWGLWVCVLITWIICFLCIIKGPTSIGYVTMITEKIPYLFLFVLIAKFVGVNKSEGGKGIQFMWGSEPFPDPDGVPYDPSVNYGSLFTDAYNQVFFSVGVCVGVMYAYGSYNHIKKPVIMDAVIIALVDFIFAILAGFITWGCIGYLQAKGDVAYNQTSSVGLTFIAFATACSKDDGLKGWFTFFMFFMYISGIDSAFSYCEALVTNILDANKGLSRVLVAGIICLFGALISILFTTNLGWVLFDLVDHYISNYLILAVGLMQCVSVGWFFEKNSTACMSPLHAKSLKWMHLLYWIPMVTIAFYANFAFQSSFEIGVYLIFVTSLIALFVSFKVSKMKARHWYHEIMLCGVDKLSMSITSLSNSDGSRSWWMLLFEGYFAIMIKFANPAVLIFLIIQNLKDDLDQPYAEQPQELQVYATTFLFAAYVLIIGAMFVCDYPELFEHNVDLEFNADNMYAASLKMKSRVEEMGKNLPK